MITKSQAKRKQDIKTKLMAAIAMLLVSSIMMVSSTYAWFTLSTAPEVTGIQTAVGANGNLEMALLPTTGALTDIKSEAGDSIKVAALKNVTWGNLVDLSDTATYGLNNITLFPSEVNIGADGKLNIATVLKTPTYRADGRVSELVANTTTAVYGTDGFKPNADANKTDYGVRGVGVISGMTERQLDYRNARQAANTASSMAMNTATSSLSGNGDALANVVIKKATQGDAATFNQTDVNSLIAIVDSLLGYEGTSGHVTGSLEYVEEAYMQYLLAIAASAASGPDDTNWNAIKSEIEKEGSTLGTVMAKFPEGTLPSALTTAIAKFNDFDGADIDSTVENVQEAKRLLTALNQNSETASYTWGDLSTVLTYLADADHMKVNNMTAAQIKDDMGKLVSSVTSMGGITVTIEPGGGVYADIADHCGNFSASVTIKEVTYGGITLTNQKARMTTSAEHSYLTTIAGLFNTESTLAAPASSGEVRPISDMYGYIIDLAFKTNAADSKLLIAKDAVDRIYSDNTNTETMGHGSSMTFKATTTTFSDDQVKGLMDAIRIVFFNPDDGTIYVKGKLDTANASIGADGVTAKLSLYTGNLGATGETTYVVATGNTVGTHKQVEVYNAIADVENWIEDIYVLEGENNYTKLEEIPETFDPNTTYYSKGFGYELLTDEEKNDPSITKYAAVTSGGDAGDVIMPLGQNTAQKLSVLVYLDGNEVGNEDVAATATQSVTGTMNLQFKSSANLVPMDYSQLHTPSATGGENQG